MKNHPAVDVDGPMLTVLILGSTGLLVFCFGIVAWWGHTELLTHYAETGGPDALAARTGMIFTPHELLTAVFTVAIAATDDSATLRGTWTAITTTIALAVAVLATDSG